MEKDHRKERKGRKGRIRRKDGFNVNNEENVKEGNANTKTTIYDGLCKSKDRKYIGIKSGR